MPQPPAQPPVVYQQQQQQQQQQQPVSYDSTSANDLKAEANGENTNVVNTKGSLSAVQVNNFNAGELYIEGVGRRPIGNINVNAFATFNGDVAVSLTYSTPIGGKSTKQFNILAQKRIEREEAKYATDLIDTCTSLQKNNVVITADADEAVLTYAQKCKGIGIVAQAPTPQVNNNFESKIDALLVKLDRLERENEALRDQLIQRNTNLLRKRG